MHFNFDNVFPLILDATNDSYSVSQTQTINFTQQTLRQRQAQPPNAQQAPQSQQQSQLGMQMNMAAQNPGKTEQKIGKSLNIRESIR